MNDMLIYNTDCLQYMHTMPDKSVDLIVTDPPYEVATQAGSGSLSSSVDRVGHNLIQAGISDGYDIRKFGKEFIRIMKNINIYVWCNKVQIPDYLDFYVNENKCKFDILCWHKYNSIPTYHGKYLSDTEYCLFFHRGVGANPRNKTDAQTYIVSKMNTSDSKKYGHPTVKPLEFTQKLIRNSSSKGDVVFDPFMGSGTTGVAATSEGRKFIGCEINEGFYQTAKERITGKSEARLEKYDLW